MKQPRQAGFSMVELMVALTLSLILIGGVLSLVYSSKLTYLENQRVAGNQEGGRAAFEMILRDLRASGFPGCSPGLAGVVPSHNLLNNPTSLLWSLDVPLQGYEGSNGTFSPALDPALSGATPAPSPSSDIIVVRTTRAGLPQLRTTVFTNTGDNITVAKAANQKIVGNTFVISDCQAETFFAATVADNGATATLTRTGTGATPGNQSNQLLANYNQYAQVTPLDTVIYYVAPSATPATEGGAVGPALWRIVSSSNNAQPEELIPGVERMELQYGVDTNSDGIVDEYDNADAVTSWANVVSVKVAILVRSVQLTQKNDVDQKQYKLLDITLPKFGDHYERSVYTTAVTLRNRTS